MARTPLRCLQRAHAATATTLALDAQPWRHWLAFYLVLLPFYSVYRCVGLPAMFRAFAIPPERTTGNKLAAVVLGFSEDVVLVTVLLSLLSAVDVAVGPSSAWGRASTQRERDGDHDDELEFYAPKRRVRTAQRRGASCSRAAALFLGTVLRRLLRLALHAALVILAIVPFATDILLLRIRGMRFTFEFVRLYLREINFTADFSVDPKEVDLANETVLVSFTVATLLVLTSVTWFDFTEWHLAKPLARHQSWLPTSPVRYTKLKISVEGAEDCSSPRRGRTARAQNDESETRDLEDLPDQRKVRSFNRRRVLQSVGIPIAVCGALCLVLLQITHAVEPIVSAAALNNSLNELFRTTTKLEFLKGLGDGTIASADVYVDSTTEEYELFRDDVLYRKTTGFKGPLAFDVKVNASDPPNVLVVVVESFRYQDSLYIVGNRSATLLKKQHNITLTPQFDRWAKRGIAFRNFWSSWPTSRSLESILFGQVPYDHLTDSGTSGGQADVKLTGMPQMFKSKGYETVFTSGARIVYDQWNKFLPSHGFEEVLSYKEFKRFAEETKGIRENDWDDMGREFSWGLHDDLSFEILGDLMINKTIEQQSRVANGEAKKPFFLNHYTISSHTPFFAAPSWYNNVDLSMLKPAYEGQPNAEDVRRYARMRYFTDMELGKLLDRMQAEGVLNDTIVVVVGDHGQSPEASMSTPAVDQIATTRVAAMLIAEGRLANYSGLILNEATEHFDLLNTLADIVGVPEDGFLQSGVGRSLKREFSHGEDRPVWTNNPQQTLAIVKGHQRLRFDRVFSMMELYDTEQDPEEKHDLLPTVTSDELREWQTLRDYGRRVSRYFRVRWDKKCISKVRC